MRRASNGRHFAERFGRQPSVWSRAPGRVDLMGSHTDYNLGYMLTQVIDRDTWIASGIEPQVYPVRAAAGAGRLGQSSTRP